MIKSAKLNWIKHNFLFEQRPWDRCWHFFFQTGGGLWRISSSSCLVYRGLLNSSYMRKLKILFVKFKCTQHIWKPYSKPSCSHLLFFGVYTDPEPSVYSYVLFSCRIIDFHRLSMKSQVCIAKLSKRDNVSLVDIMIKKKIQHLYVFLCGSH